MYFLSSDAFIADLRLAMVSVSDLGIKNSVENSSLPETKPEAKPETETSTLTKEESNVDSKEKEI